MLYVVRTQIPKAEHLFEVEAPAARGTGGSSLAPAPRSASESGPRGRRPARPPPAAGSRQSAVWGARVVIGLGLIVFLALIATARPQGISCDACRSTGRRPGGRPNSRILPRGAE